MKGKKKKRGNKFRLLPVFKFSGECFSVIKLILTIIAYTERGKRECKRLIKFNSVEIRLLTAHKKAYTELIYVV
ncbi:CLUMA_CG000308, isoform A [Clunio marinus]|uniref:CLUMA_CG000308, isoform A n=1 Tax=Clunio marinus TaxID=568069 RepID=A0A1J1HEP6_9DIPT|nr:CLUMA_CG000308, isoform A [Clunio marinus]